MDLTLSWNGEKYVAPQPAVVPPEKLAAGLRKWDRFRDAFWRVDLDDGRRAVVIATPSFEGDPVVAMHRVYVYRADGTLEIDQDNSYGGPNEPIEWTVYEADGRTPHARVSARPRLIPLKTTDGRTHHGRDFTQGPWFITEVLFYRDGLPSQRYFVANASVQWEEQYLPDGTSIIVNARDGVLSPEYKAALEAGRRAS